MLTVVKGWKLLKGHINGVFGTNIRAILAVNQRVQVASFSFGIVLIRFSTLIKEKKSTQIPINPPEVLRCHARYNSAVHQSVRHHCFFPYWRQCLHVTAIQVSPKTSTEVSNTASTLHYNIVIIRRWDVKHIFNTLICVDIRELVWLLNKQ